MYSFMMSNLVDGILLVISFWHKINTSNKTFFLYPLKTLLSQQSIIYIYFRQCLVQTRTENTTLTDVKPAYLTSLKIVTITKIYIM